MHPYRLDIIVGCGIGRRLRIFIQIHLSRPAPKVSWHICDIHSQSARPECKAVVVYVCFLHSVCASALIFSFVAVIDELGLACTYGRRVASAAAVVVRAVLRLLLINIPCEPVA